MRVAVLTTGTNNTKPLYEPLRAFGHDLTPIIYDAMPEHSALPGMVEMINPDWVLLIGAIEAHHGKPVPKVDVLARIGERRLMVHLCCDGAEPAWWHQLQSYYDSGNFALQVNIDGVRIGPIGDRGLVMLCPIDPEQFPNPPRSWAARTVQLGFGGGLTPPRAAALGDLIRRGLLTHRERDAEGYDGYREFLCSCRCTLNNSLTGGGSGQQHVKARVIEAALAGSLVLEPEGSPTADWFEPGVDYLAYGSAEDVARKIDWVRDNASEAEVMALRLRGKIVADHSPAMFWGRVLERLGIGKQMPLARKVPFRHWSLDWVPGHLRPPPPLASQPPTRLSLTQPPMFLESKGSVNFVSWRGDVYAIPQRLGPIRLEEINLARFPAILRYTNLAQAQMAK